MRENGAMGKVLRCAVAGCTAAVLIAGCASAPVSDSSSRARADRFSSQDAADIMISSSAAGEADDGQEAADASASSSSAASSSSESARADSSSSSASSVAGPKEFAHSPEFDQLNADIEAAVAASGMDAGVAVVDLTTGSYTGFQGSSSMVSASMIKLAIAAAFLEQVKAGAYSLDDVYVLQASDIVGGTGTLGGLGAGASVTYRDILMRMIDVSDNTGANILIDAAGGMDAVNAEARRLGLQATELNRYMMDSAAMAAGVENYVSADDCAALLQMIYEGTFVDSDSSMLVLQALEQQQDYGGIRGGIPGGVAFAHKTGTLTTVRHDGGIVEGQHPYVLVVLCGGSGFYEQGALSLMSQIGSLTYEAIADAA